jgi:hypothetical protein
VVDVAAAVAPLSSQNGFVFDANGSLVTAVIDPFWSNVVLLVKASGVPGSTVLTDLSSFNNPITYFTGAGMSNAQFWPQGSGVSLAMPNRHEVTDSPAFDFGTGAFTIEFMGYFPTVGGGFMFGIPYGGNNIGIGANSSFGDLDFEGPGGAGRSTVALPRDQWVYVVASRTDGNIFSIWANGTQHRSVSGGAANVNMSSTLRIGGVSGGTNATAGFMDQLRITRGVARYSVASPPPATLAASFPVG